MEIAKPIAVALGERLIKEGFDKYGFIGKETRFKTGQSGVPRPCARFKTGQSGVPRLCGGRGAELADQIADPK